MDRARAGDRVQENDRDTSEHLSVHGSFTVTFSKFPTDGDPGRLLPAAAFSALFKVREQQTGRLWGYLVLARPEEGWHDREALWQVECSHLYSCGFPALLF